MPHAFSRPTAYVERVLEVVEAIPPGRVMSYGDIAEYLGEAGPRQVGAVMSAWGGAVCWWRVIRADGSPPSGHEVEALAHYAAEATPMRPSGDRVDMRRAAWDGEAPPERMGQPESDG
ncbi:cysteine methyltransferase [Streptomonospora alba]|uniref:Cysteine methyltransferase n=1 Tax=Streptomonospora alba TaxID=183763 RepID=A0A0C2GB01_9ACTN|nr:MGMT family protein [Streptomonospora alba]KII00574.1 cysteine methyltransferase [Streptomonospora alba]